MANGWRPVVVPEEIYQRAREYYERNKDDLKLRNGIRSFTGFVNFCIREFLKEKGAI